MNQEPSRPAAPLVAGAWPGGVTYGAEVLPGSEAYGYVPGRMPGDCGGAPSLSGLGGAAPAAPLLGVHNASGGATSAAVPSPTTAPSAAAAFAYSRFGYAPPTPRTVPGIEVGKAWRWAWSRLWCNPLLAAVMPAWATTGVVALLLVTTPAVGHSGARAVLLLVAAVLACLGSLAMGLTGLSHACLVVSRGERARLRDLLVVPNGLSAWLATLTAVLAVLIGCTAPVVAVVAFYFLVFTTLVAVDQRACVLRAIGRSCSLARAGRGQGGMGAVWLVVLALQVLGVLSVVGWVVTVPVEVLMVTYGYRRLALARPSGGG